LEDLLLAVWLALHHRGFTADDSRAAKSNVMASAPIGHRSAVPGLTGKRAAIPSAATMDSESACRYTHRAAPPNPMQTIAQPEGYQRQILRIAVILILLTSPVWMLLMFYTPEFDLGAGIVLLPCLMLLTLGLIYRLSKSNHWERNFLLTGAVFKLVCVGMYNGMVFFIYHGGTDSITYYREGVDWASNLGMLGAEAILHPYWGTPFITMLSGTISYVAPSDALVAGAFALLGLWGQYLAYRAFVIAVPEGNRFDMALLVFLVPSLSFWSASVGKEAMCILGIGICAYGYARASAQANPGGFLISGLGIALAGLARPHIAAMLALAVAGAIAMSTNKKGIIGVLNKFVGIPLVIAGSIYIVAKAQTFVNASDFSSGVTSLNRLSQTSNIGGSGFSGSLTTRVLFAPFLLFRPFPWEVRSSIMAIASLEGTAMLIVFWRRRRSLFYAIRHWRNPFILFIFMFGLQFIVVFSAAISNFGILTRERIMLLPLALMLVCLPAWHRVPARIGLAKAAKAVPRPGWGTAVSARSTDLSLPAGRS
jgi:hypothetical protein